MCFSYALATSTSIRFATEATYPPFESINSQGEIQGFDIDIAKALCNEMNAQCHFYHQAFNSLIPSLSLGKYDAVISALGVTEERVKKVAFTQSYYEPSGSFVGLIKNRYQLSQIAQQIIGVQSGSTYEHYLKDTYGSSIKMKSYASIQDAYLDLTASRVNAVLADTEIVQTWLKSDNHQSTYQIIEHPIINHQYFGAGYAVAVSKNNTDLLNEFNKALVTIKANGVYNKIVNQYFNHE